MKRWVSSLIQSALRADDRGVGNQVLADAERGCAGLDEVRRRSAE